MQKFVGGTALWMPKSGSPHTPSEKAIKELIDTDLPFPMPYGGKRKGLIAIPTRFCIEPKIFRTQIVLQLCRVYQRGIFILFTGML